MRRLRRIILNGLTALSLLLMLGVLVAVVGSDFPGDEPWHWASGTLGQPRRFLTIAKTEVCVTSYVPTKPGTAGPRAAPVYWRFGGFEFDNAGCSMTASMAAGAPQYDYAGYRLVIPLWPIFLASLGALGFRVRTWLMRRRRRPGFCAKCGYDLRATPERCPECGTIVKTKPLDAASKLAG